MSTFGRPEGTPSAQRFMTPEQLADATGKKVEEQKDGEDGEDGEVGEDGGKGEQEKEEEEKEKEEKSEKNGEKIEGTRKSSFKTRWYMN